MTDATPSRIRIFYDGDCPLCTREIEMVRGWVSDDDVAFTDIAAADFDPDRWGKSRETLMAEIHGLRPDDTWTTGVDVFRELYAAAGLGPLVELTKLPGVADVLDAAYEWFADRRLHLTGRCEDGVCQHHASGESEPR